MARELGISMVYQHFSLFDTLTAAENVWLGLDKAQSLAQVTQRIRDVAGTYGLDMDPLRPVHTLSVGERQRVEIVRALLTDAEARDDSVNVNAGRLRDPVQQVVALVRALGGGWGDDASRADEPAPPATQRTALN